MSAPAAADSICPRRAHAGADGSPSAGGPSSSSLSTGSNLTWADLQSAGLGDPEQVNPIVEYDVDCDASAVSDWFTPFRFAPWEPTYFNPTLKATYRLRAWRNRRDGCSSSPHRIKGSPVHEQELFTYTIRDGNTQNVQLQLAYQAVDGSVQNMPVKFQAHASGGTICFRHTKYTLSEPWTCDKPERSCAPEGCCNVVCYPLRQKDSVFPLRVLAVEDSYFAHVDIEAWLENPEECAPGQCAPSEELTEAGYLLRAAGPDPASAPPAAPRPSSSSTTSNTESCTLPGHGRCRVPCLRNSRTYDCISHSFCSQLVSNCARLNGRKLRQVD